MLRWCRGAFRHAALPASDILAYKRHIDGHLVNSVPILGVLWAGADQTLHQRIFAPGWGWMDDIPVAYLLKAGAFAGSWNGSRFRDSDAGCATKTIQRIICRSGDILDGIQLCFTDGSSTLWRGGQGRRSFTFTMIIANYKPGGVQQQFDLAPGSFPQTLDDHH
jgi:hypothetical protein